MLWSPNLQLHYPFENQANDYSGNAWHGTVNGSGVYATKPNGGRCLYFDGTDDTVGTPSFGLSGTVVVFAADIRCKVGSYQGILSTHYVSGHDIMYCSRRGGTGDTYNLGWRYWTGSASVDAIATSFFTAPYEDVWVHLLVACDYPGKKTYFYREGMPFGSPVSMSGTPFFPTTDNVKFIGCYVGSSSFLTGGYLANVYLGTLLTMPPDAQMLANAKRLMLGINPIW